MPMTAHSATPLWPLNTSSMPHDVDDVVGAARHVDVVVVVFEAKFVWSAVMTLEERT